jgi:transposase-like protein
MQLWCISRDPVRPRVAVLVALLLATALGCSREPAFRRQAEEEGLIAAIRETLLSSVEAEKSAVLATTDEESLAMARESRHLGERIDALVGDLRRRVEADGRPAVTERFATFVASWEELKALDDQLLALAVANTNLKAMRLAAREGLAAVDRLLVALDAMGRSSTDLDTIRLLSRVEVAALREQTLLLIHIPTADDAEMTRLERQMSDLAASVARALETLRSSGVVPTGALDTAAEAWTEHRRIVTEVVKLSRENTNLRSFDVSVHEKRSATRACLDALAALRTAVASSPQANR